MQPSSRQNHPGEKPQHAPCHVVVDLMSIDDPDTWVLPPGPAISPPKHIQEILHQRALLKREQASFSTRQFQKPPILESDVNLRKDFFKLQHPKNAHHVGYEVADFLRHHKKEKLTASVNFATGWYVLKQIFNPEVFEAMTELITPIENYEFYAAFQAFVAYVHNHTIIFQLRSKEDSVEIWSRNFCKKLVQLGETRPSIYHTVVIPLILKPMETREALFLIGKEWRKTSIASWAVPAFSGYGRAVNRWILPLTEPFEEDQQGILKKPLKKTVRLDLGYLFSQRRRFGKLARLPQTSSRVSTLEEKGLAYRITRKNQEPRKPGSRKNFRGKPQSKQSLALGISQANPSNVASTIGGQRGSMRHTDFLNPSVLTVKPKKFVLERLLRANKRKPPLERLYWIHHLPRNHTQPPSIFTKLGESNETKTSPERQSDSEFLTTYYPIARRELYTEPEKDPALLHSQYDPNILRDMIKEEISASFNNARSQIDNSDALICRAQKPMINQAALLRDHVASLERQMFNNKISPVEEDPFPNVLNGTLYQKKQYLNVLSKNHVIDFELSSANACKPGPNKPKQDPKIEKMVGSKSLNATRNWSVLTNEIANRAATGSEPNPRKSGSAQSKTAANLNVRDVLLDPAKDANEQNSLFVRLVIDSGYKHFYFEIGGDSDEEDDVMPEDIEESAPMDNKSRRRQSSLAAEGMSPETFEYLDKNALNALAEMFGGMQGQPYEEWMDGEYRRVAEELGRELPPTIDPVFGLVHSKTIASSEEVPLLSSISRLKSSLNPAGEMTNAQVPDGRPNGMEDNQNTVADVS